MHGMNTVTIKITLAGLKQAMSSTEGNDFCRLCKENSRINGTLCNTKKIYEPGGAKDKNIFQRLDTIGLTLQPQVNKSCRICMKCFRLIQKIEDSLSTLKKWKLSEETGSEQASTPTNEKRERELITSKPPRTLKKKTHNTSTHNGTQSTTAAATTSKMPPPQSVTVTAPYEESCSGITFDVSEFTFDEENNCSNEVVGETEIENICSNEEGGEEEEEIDNSYSDWEKDDSDQLESHDSDQLWNHDLDERDSELPKNVHQLCPECGAFFCLGKTHTCEYKIKPVSCNFCGKRCVDKSALKAHSNIHKESYEHPCRFCMAPFKTRLDKLAHESTHTRKEKTYEIPDCSMSFSKLPARNLHLTGHRGTNIFSFPHCALEFRSANHMERHIKQFVCEFCSHSFSQQSHLKSHLRVHTGEKPYQCKHCDKSFNHNVRLKSHVMRYHKEASGPGPSRPMKPKKKTYRRSMGRPKGRPQKNAATEDSIPAVRGEAPDPTTAVETSEKGHLRKASSKDIERDWSDRDPSSELTEGDEGEESKGVRKSKREASQRPKTYYIAEKDFESDSDSNPGEKGKKRQAVKSQETGQCTGRPRKNTVV